MLRRFFFIDGVNRSFSAVHSRETGTNSFDPLDAFEVPVDLVDGLPIQSHAVVLAERLFVRRRSIPSPVGPVAKRLEVRDEDGTDELPLVADDHDLVDSVVRRERVLDGLGRDVLPRREDDDLLDAVVVGQEAVVGLFDDVPVRNQLSSVNARSVSPIRFQYPSVTFGPRT